MTTNDRDGKKIRNFVDLFTYLMPLILLHLFALSLSLSISLTLKIVHSLQWQIGVRCIGGHGHCSICACFAIPFNVTNAVALMHDADTWVTVILVRLFYSKYTFFSHRFPIPIESTRFRSQKIGWKKKFVFDSLSFGVQFLFVQHISCFFLCTISNALHVSFLPFFCRNKNNTYFPFNFGWDSISISIFQHWKMILLQNEVNKMGQRFSKLFAFQNAEIN